MFITVEELKTSVLNANLDEEYINPAIYEAEDVYLREILGDRLYTVLWNKTQSETLSGKYLTLVNSYIKPYLTYKVQSILVVPINFKMRNAGVVNQYDQGFTTSTVKDTAYLAEHYDGRAEFYANRLTTYLKQNASDLPEYGYSADNITNPSDSQNVTTLYLGGTRKKCNYIPTGSGGTTGTVNWDDIENRPNFADVATSGDYEDLENKPEIGNGILYITQNNIVKGVFRANQTGNTTVNLSGGGQFTQEQADWNESDNTKVTYIQNKPTIPTKTSQLTNDSGFTTFDGDYNSLTNKPNFATVATTGSYNDLTDKPTVTQVQADWSQTDSTQPDYINNKPTIPAAQVNSDWNASSGVAQILNKPTLAQVATSGDYRDLENTPNFATVATSGDYDDLTNKPTIPAAQVQADWQQNDSTQPDYIKNRPSMPSAQVQADWNQTNTSEVDYIKNKPAIPAAQVNADWNANSGVAQILNKPTIPTKTSQLTNDSGFTTFDGDYNSLTNKPNFATVATTGSYDDLTNKPNFATVATSGDYNDLIHTPTIPAAQVNSDWNANSGVAQILNKPSLAQVATSGNYNDLTNKPIIPAAQVNSDWNASSGVSQILNKPTLATVATSGSYNDLENKPTIPTVNDGSLTIQKNGTTIASFTANESSNKTANITVPTDETDLGLSTETWTFTVDDGQGGTTTVTKQVVIK